MKTVWILATPSGIHVHSGGKVRNHYFSRMTSASFSRMYHLLEKALRVEPNKWLWEGGHKDENVGD